MSESIQNRIIEDVEILAGKIFCAEGPIGIGKTSLCQSMKHELDKVGIPTVFYPEPFNQTMLEQFLSNPSKYAYAFQMYMLTRRQVTFVKAINEARQGKFCIIDRSLIGDFVFARLQFEQKNISNDDFMVYCQEYRKFEEYSPDCIIYLDANIDKQLERIHNRNRAGEDKYEEDYLKMLNAVYVNTLQEHYNAPNKKVQILDWNQHNTVINGLLESDIVWSVIEKVISGIRGF